LKDLEKIIEQILPIDKDKLQEGQRYCDQLGKPPGSLGKLETIYARLHAMFSGPIDLEKKIVLVYVADNGIVAEGVSANPQETTYTVAVYRFNTNSSSSFMACDSVALHRKCRI